MDAFTAVWGLLTEPWALLMLIASLAYAGMNYLDEWLLGHLGGDTPEKKGGTDAVGTLIIISGLFGILIALVFVVVDFINTSPDTSVVVKPLSALKAMGAGMFEVLYLIPYYYATRRAGTMNAAPLFQSIPVISLVLGLLLFKESPPAVHIIGSLVIVAGAILLNFAPGTFRLDLRTVGLMLLASTMVSLLFFLFKGAAVGSNFVAAAFWNGIGMFTASVLILLTYPPYRREFCKFMRSIDVKSVGIQSINEVADAFAGLASQYAMTIGPSVMAVSALSAYQPVFIFMIGGILAFAGSKTHADQLRGSEFYKKFTAIALIALGTVLIAQ